MTRSEAACACRTPSASRGALICKSMSRCVFNEARDACYLLGTRTADSGGTHCREQRLRKLDGKTARARLMAANDRAAGGACGLRMTLVEPAGSAEAFPA